MAHVATSRGYSERTRWLVAFAIIGVLSAVTIVAVVLVRHGQPGSQPSGGLIPPPRTTSSSSSATANEPASTTPSPSPTVDPTVAAILNADDDAARATLHALATSDPLDPLLRQHLSGVALSNTTKQLLIDQADGIVRLGDSRHLHAQVVSMTPTTAVVNDCVFGTVVAYHRATHVPVVPGADTLPGSYESSTENFVLVDGVWKLTQSERRIGCDGH